MANVMIDSTKDLLKGYNNNVRHFAAILGKNKDEQIAVDSRIHVSYQHLLFCFDFEKNCDVIDSKKKLFKNILLSTTI